ncbi:MAG: succinate dehydrogenase flavoprotein subunit [Chlamydiia bacterium]
MPPSASRDVIVVGGGLAGLACTVKLAEQGHRVQLISVTKVKRSHSVCAQGGINAALNLKNQGDSPYVHFIETVKGGDFLADQPPVLEMCLTAPGIIRMMDRFGCPFNRLPDGSLDVRGFGGTLYQRTVFCGASTGQQLLYTLDEQVRRYEAAGLVKKYENHEFLRVVLDEAGVARGIVLLDYVDMSLRVLKADAVVICSGGCGLIYRRSTNSTFCTGAANGRLFMQGMHYANGEFIQIHPTSIPGPDKYRLVSESARGEGGRVWVYGDSSRSIGAPDGRMIPCGVTGEPWYFLEELYPAYGNLVARDIAAREILRVCQLGLGINGGLQVYLDVSHLPPATQRKLASVLEIYEKYTGEDPRKVPMKVFPGVHYSMGGAWVDWPAANAYDRWTRYRQMTNLPGVFAAGECEFQYHGANRLGANALLSCIYAGMVAGTEIPRYLDALPATWQEIPSIVFDQALSQEEAFKRDLLGRAGPENSFCLHDELGLWMIEHVTVLRRNADLIRTLEKIHELKDRFRNIQMGDSSSVFNQAFIHAHQFRAMLELAAVITKSALERNESRGAHYKEEFPERNDADWLKTTVAKYRPDGPQIDYLPVDLSYLRPYKRDYTEKASTQPVLENLPDHITLPI